MRSFQSALKCFGSFLFIGTLMVLIGCGGGGPKDAANSVKGKITVKGSPCAGGTITFHGDKQSKDSPIIAGTYQVDNPPLGMVKVSVKTLSLGGAPAQGKKLTTPDVKDKAPSLLEAGGGEATPNKKYESPETSGLTYEVKAGKQNKDFDLDP